MKYIHTYTEIIRTTTAQHRNNPDKNAEIIRTKTAQRRNNPDNNSTTQK